MESQKGVTLISLTIYVVGMSVIIALIVVVSNFFYSNIEKNSDVVNPTLEYTRFNTFFSDEVTHSNIKVLECKSNYVTFDNGVQYTFIEANKGIYRNKVKIVKDVSNCQFSLEMENGKQIVKVVLQIADSIKENVYTLQN